MPFLAAVVLCVDGIHVCLGHRPQFTEQPPSHEQGAHQGARSDDFVGRPDRD